MTTLQKRRAIFVYGPPFGGKTTYCKSNDFYEYVYFPKKGSQNKLDEFKRLVDFGFNIIVDDSGSMEYRQECIKIAHGSKLFEYVLDCHILATSIHDVVVNATGEPRFNKSMVINWYTNFRRPALQEGWSSIVEIPFHRRNVQNSTRKAIIFSLYSVLPFNVNFLVPNGNPDFTIMPDVIPVFQKYYNDGYKFVCVARFPEMTTNKFSESIVQECLLKFLRVFPIPVDDVYYTADRGSFQEFTHQLQVLRKIDIEQSIMVGNGSVDFDFKNYMQIGDYFHRNFFFKPKEPHVR